MSPALQPVVVLTALPREAAPLLAYARTEPRLLLRVTGVGRARAEQAIATILRECPPALVITAGFAGGLRPGLPVGTVLFEADAALPLAAFLQQAGAMPGRFHCTERMLITAREKAACHHQTGADAVEMESGWIREHCRRAGVVSATVRVISDAAEEDLPLDFNQLTDAEQQLSPLKLAGAVLKNPGALAGLRRLQRQTAFASRRLAEVLQTALQEWWTAR
jgi:nucleoside phosphorylase